MPQIIASKIAGIFRYPEAKQLINSLPEGAAIDFKRDPNNPHDPNAIALYVSGPSQVVDAGGGVTIQTADIKQTQCGWIPKETAAMLKAVKDFKIKKGSRFDSIIIEIS